MSKQIMVEFDRFGNTRIEALGFTGTGCVEATAYVEQALRGDKTKDDAKPDMYAPSTTGQTEQNMRF